MIYLFGTGAYDSSRKAVKVGFTDDQKTREQHYLLHNPLGKFIGWRDGDEVTELKLHLRLMDYQVEFLEEWFYDEPDVHEIFGLPEQDIDKWIWENRSRCFPTLPRPGTLRRQVFAELQEKYGGVVESEKSL